MIEDLLTEIIVYDAVVKGPKIVFFERSEKSFISVHTIII